MNEDNKNLENEIDEEKFEELTDTQLAFDALSLEEEIKRIEKQDSELVIPKVVQNSEVFQNMTCQAYAVANGFRILLNAGVDYNNALAVVSNMSVGYDNREMAKVQTVQVQQQMV